MKTLIFDIERFPNIVYSWGIYEQNALKIIREGYTLSFCAKWLNGPTILRGLCDYKGYKGGPDKEKELAKDLWKLFDEADVIIAHNGDRFDIPYANAMFYKYKLGVPSPYKTIDTMKVWSKNFKTNSKSLRYTAEYSGIEKKKENDGFPLWEGCDKGDLKSWKQMKAYNKQDVVVTEQLYLELLPWISNHPTPKDGKRDCPNCHSDNVHKKGPDIIKGERVQRYRCMECGTPFNLRV